MDYFGQKQNKKKTFNKFHLHNSKHMACCKQKKYHLNQERERKNFDHIIRIIIIHSISSSRQQMKFNVFFSNVIFIPASQQKEKLCEKTTHFIFIIIIIIDFDNNYISYVCMCNDHVQML